MRIGIDIGSRYTKIAYWNDGGEFSFQKYDSTQFYREFGESKDNKFFISRKKLGFPTEAKIIATGYGRERAKLAGASEISEINAHAMGARFMLGIGTFTLADLGGQDVKVIRVEDDRVIDFHTSDRCAASTGRFLEGMARVLNISENELGKHFENPVELSATCAVFAETEILDLLSRGIPVERLAAGANYAVVKKFIPILKRFPIDIVVVTGGVAMNNAVIQLLRRELNESLNVPDDMQFAGAVGCVTYDGK